MKKFTTIILMFLILGGYSFGASEPPALATYVARQKLTAASLNSNNSILYSAITDGTKRIEVGELENDGQTKLSDGTLALPSLIFTADPDTGFYRVGGNEIAFVASGNAIFDIRGDSLRVSQNFIVDNINIDGNDISSTAGNLTLTPVAGSAVVIDGGASFDGTAVTGLTALTSTAITGTLQTAAQPNITSLGTLTSLTIIGDDATDFNGLVLQNTNTTSGTETTFTMPIFNGTPGLSIRQSGNATGPAWASGAYDAILATGQAASKLHLSAGSSILPDLTIAASGAIGIGATTPATIGTDITPLNIKGSVSGKTGGIILNSSDDSVYMMMYGSTADDATSPFTFNAFSNHGMRFETNDVERMRITEAGNIGIGTTAPLDKLEINGSTFLNAVDASLFLGNGGATHYASLLFKNSTNLLEINHHYSSGGTIFKTNSTERMRIDINGSVGIGHSTIYNNDKLYVNGVITAGTDISTNGATIIQGKYGESTNDYLNIIGNNYSNGANVIGFAVRPKNGSAGFVSSADKSSWERSALVLDGALTFNTGPGQTTTINADVSLTERFRVGNTGILSTGGETAPDADAGGLTLKTTSGVPLTFKDTGVAHGVTTILETDTVSSIHTGTDGLMIKSAGTGSSSSSPMEFQALSLNSNTGFEMNHARISGTGTAALPDTANIMTFYNNGTQVAGLSSGGTISIDGGFDGPLTDIGVTGTAIELPVKDKFLIYNTGTVYLETLSGGVTGQLIIIHNSAGATLTIKHFSSEVGQTIITNTGGDLTVIGFGGVTLVNGYLGRWYVIGAAL